MNYTLGGSFASRINMNLREEHGYTYGASSAYRGYRSGGQFIAGGLMRTDVTAPAAKELMGEITRFPTHLPSETELNASKDALVQSLPGEFETTSSATGAMQSIFLYDRPLDYYAKLPERFRAVTAEDIARVAKEDLHPSGLVIVAAGDRAKIEPALKDAGLGPVEVRDIDGDLVTK
jgi:zinc protease